MTDHASSDFERTRLSLHAVAELLLASPQYAESGTIKLRATPGGFGTVKTPDARVEGNMLVVGDRAFELSGRTVQEVADAAGIVLRSLDDLYSGGCGLTGDHSLVVHDACAARIAEAFRRGEEALAAFAPEAPRVLWPEHFDLGISIEPVNYGVSPGDSSIPEPYAYVGPWRPSEYTGQFWNQPFGAARRLSELEDITAFFAEGAGLL
jgi:hypothetical protein